MKIYIYAILFALFPVIIYAEYFTPTPMTISVQPQLEYKFDGAPLEIPFTLNGTSAALWLVINTHGQADKINAIRNGYLGWHYVNKIDTTIYISQKFERTPGENTIIWDGKDENGNIPEPGEYDYYLWGYDNLSSNELVSNYLRVGFGFFEQCTQLYEKDNQGLPLPQPILMGNFFRTEYYIYEEDLFRQGTHFKWTIGSDPMDKSLIQTSFCSMYFPELPNTVEHDYGTYVGVDLNPEYITFGGSVFDPRNYNIFYQPSYKAVPQDNNLCDQYCTILKWTFVAGGEAILDNNWNGFNNYLWNDADLNYRNACIANNDYIYISNGEDYDFNSHNKIVCFNYSGELIFDKNFNEWYMPEILMNRSGGFNTNLDKIYTRQTDRIFMISTLSCMHQMINTSRLYVDPDDETDMVIFTNSNGDYFFDNGDVNQKNPWYCKTSDSDFGSRQDVRKENQVRNSLSIDTNGFNFIFVRNYGIASFGISTQDGTGIGYMSFADDNADKSCQGGQICDNGSAYDGIYFSRDVYDSYGWLPYKTKSASTYYMAFDSAHGMITNEIAVKEENTPYQFKVNQNTPNPFNPTTTISFTIPEKGNASIDIYNVAGQKVKTLVNGYMSAGEHSVRWDANGCSAGVYFYKVKSGKFERTMKMMLVR